ncbi:hypothetical protein Franean1_0080 [Parafrankia sp. EAN1pec]|uniref:hypothetical protein n=1 Tax=Parafrankia sp. (strain EAN1pec) TaxID=298653 RepID=UPI0000542089|nr:hypothetical protein Franean1_0080 [Frankia sp. EAN1pec]
MRGATGPASTAVHGRAQTVARRGPHRDLMQARCMSSDLCNGRTARFESSSRRPGDHAGRCRFPSLALGALHRQRSRQAKERIDAGEHWWENGLVFASTVGTLMEPRNVTRRVEQLRDRAGLP